MELKLVLTHAEVTDLQTPILVEGWKKKNFGTGKRKFEAEFSPAEREQLDVLYHTVTPWLMRGAPLRWAVPGRSLTECHANLGFIKRAVHFFATL